MGVAPSVPQLQDKTVKRGDVIEFCWVANCEVNAKWIKDGQTFRDGGRISKLKDRKRFTLTIKDAREEDEGEYSLELWNRHGTVSGSAKVTVLAPQLQVPELQDKAVKRKDVISFGWVANCEANAIWIKDGQVLEDGGRISITKSDDSKYFTLTIRDATEEDEGKYILELWNRYSKVSGSAKVTALEYDADWRKFNWKENNIVKGLLREIHPSNSELSHLRFLLYGCVGAGKSSIINSINSVFQGCCNVYVPTAAVAASSCTKNFKTYSIKDKEGRVLPFFFNDVMGLEDTGDAGALPGDIISALKGHIREGYEFKPLSPLSEGDSFYNSSPTLNDKVHCLISVVPADKISLWSATEGVIIKMKEVREAASDLGIPQVVFMTDIDLCCPLVKNDLKHIYSSKRIKRAMQHCSNKLGVPMNCIFPVKNYSEENSVNDKTDCLILDALKLIVYFANDYVKDM